MPKVYSRMSKVKVNPNGYRGGKNCEIMMGHYVQHSRNLEKVGVQLI